MRTWPTSVYSPLVQRAALLSFFSSVAAPTKYATATSTTPIGDIETSHELIWLQDEQDCFSSKTTMKREARKEVALGSVLAGCHVNIEIRAE